MIGWTTTRSALVECKVAFPRIVCSIQRATTGVFAIRGAEAGRDGVEHSDRGRLDMAGDVAGLVGLFEFDVEEVAGPGLAAAQ